MTHKFSIVGMNHLNAEAAIAELRSGDPLMLVREPDNKYDPNAVMVWASGKHIGYVPKKSNTELAAKIDDDGEDRDVPVIVDGETKTVKRRSVAATFARSPNSGYPMAEMITEPREETR